MYEKMIEYVDYNGEKRKEKFYFNLTKSEITEMEFSKKGGLKNFVTKVANEGNTTETFALFKKIILASVGVKSNDGKRFIKGDEVKTNFEECPAYDEFMMTIIQDSKELANFINGVMPSGAINGNVENIQKQLEDNEYANVVIDDIIPSEVVETKMDNPEVVEAKESNNG